MHFYRNKTSKLDKYKGFQLVFGPDVKLNEPATAKEMIIEAWNETRDGAIYLWGAAKKKYHAYKERKLA